jgi:hypothetical protein
MVTIDIFHKNIHERPENLNDLSRYTIMIAYCSPKRGHWINVYCNFRNCKAQVAKVTKLARSIRDRSDFAVNPRLWVEKSAPTVYLWSNIAWNRWNSDILRYMIISKLWRNNMSERLFNAEFMFLLLCYLSIF